MRYVELEAEVFRPASRLTLGKRFRCATRVLDEHASADRTTAAVSIKGVRAGFAVLRTKAVLLLVAHYCFTTKFLLQGFTTNNHLRNAYLVPEFLHGYANQLPAGMRPCLSK